MKNALSSFVRLLRAPRQLRAWLFWIAASLFCAGISALLVAVWRDQDGLPVRYYITCASATLLGISFFSVSLYATHTAWVRQHFMPFAEPINRGHVIIGTVIGILITVLSLYLSNHLDFNSLKQNPGGLFTLVTGTVTIIGVYLTLQSVLDIRATITSFPELIERLCDLINRTPDPEGDPARGDYVRFLASTPALGFLARPENEWWKLKEVLRRDPHKVQITCLDQQDLQLWHELFSGRITDRGKLDAELVGKATCESEHLLEDMTGFFEASRKKWDRLPGYYIFANNRRAIIVAPFFVPLPVGTPPHGQLVELPSVQMLGFETTDPSIVRMALRLYQVYRDRVPGEAPFFREGEGDENAVEEQLALIGKEMAGSSLSQQLKADAGLTIRFRVEAFCYRRPN